MSDLPEYLPREPVRAARITSVDATDDVLGLDVDGRSADRYVGPGYMHEHNPQRGGYYVCAPGVEAGYLPADVFERLFVRVEG